MYNRILVPVSRSQWEDEVIRHAVEHAIEHEAEMHAVHVVAEEILEKMDEDESVETGEITSHTAEEVLMDVKSKVPSEVEFTGVELGGAPASSILQYAKENDVDLIVMGTHGRSGVQRYLLGSVAEEVVRNSDCAVLTVNLKPQS